MEAGCNVGEGEVIMEAAYNLWEMKDAKEVSYFQGKVKEKMEDACSPGKVDDLLTFILGKVENKLEVRNDLEKVRNDL